MPHQFHEPVRRLPFDLQNHFAFEFAQPLVHEKKRDKNRRDANRHEPLITHVTPRMKDQPFRRQLIIKLLHQWFPLRSLQLQAQMRNLFLEQILIAKIDPIG